MATFSYTNTFSSGAAVVASEFNANFDDVRDFVVGANLDTDNLATPYANLVVSFEFGDLSASTSDTRRYHIPSAQSVEWVEANLGRTDGGGVARLQFTDDGTDVLSTPLTNSSDDTVTTSTGFDVSSTAGGSTIVITASESGGANPANGVHVTLWAKVKLRS